MKDIMIQLMTAFIGVVGFSIMFNVRGSKLFINGLGGAVSWLVYIITLSVSSDKVISCFTATVFMAVLSEILARVIKTPVILLLVPMIVPLIPGSDLYYMMTSMLLKEAATASRFGVLLAGEAAAIAFGIIIVTSVTQIIVRITLLFKKQ